MAFENIFSSFKNKITNDVKIPFYLFLAFALLCFSALILNILNHSDMIFDPLFYRQPDFSFFLYVLAIILGSIAIYKLVRYYFEFESIDYLFVAGFIFGSIVFLYLWQIWTQYISSIITDLIATRDVEAWISAIQPELIIANPAFWVGNVFLLLFVVRLKQWNTQPKILRVLFIIAIINAILEIIYVTIFILTNDINPARFGLHHTEWFYHLTINSFPLLFFDSVDPLYEQLTYPLFITYYLLIIMLVTTKPAGKSTRMALSRYFWVFFGVIQIIGSLYKVVFADPIFIIAEFLVSFQVLFLLGLLIFLFTGPEVIFLTDDILFRAKKLFTVIEKRDESKNQSSKDSILSGYSDYRTRIKTYLDTIPTETLEDIKSLNNSKW